MRSIPVLPAFSFWTKPEPARMGNADRETIFLAVGQALTHWETLETMLAMVFRGLIRSEDDAASTRVYGLLSGPKQRGEVLKELLFHFSASAINSAWKEAALTDELLKHYALAADRRNNFAHGVVTGLSNDSGSLGFFLCPGHFNSRQMNSQVAVAVGQVRPDARDPYPGFGHRFRYTAEQIQSFSAGFLSLCEVATHIASSLIHHETSRRMARFP